MFAAVNDMPQPLKDLAPKLGVRTLYELSGAWKRDAKRTGALVAAKGEAITTAEARALAAELKAAKATTPRGKPVAGDNAPEPAAAAPGRRKESLDIQTPSPSQAGGAAHEGGADAPATELLVDVDAAEAQVNGFEVKVGKRTGRLLLAAGPDPETVLIAFDGASVEPTPAATVRLVRAWSE